MNFNPIIQPQIKLADYRKSGRYFSTSIMCHSSVADNVMPNFLQAYPMIVTKPLAIDRLSCFIIDGSNCGGAKMGIYDDENIYPKNLLVSGTIDTQGWSYYCAETPIDMILQPGLYWLVGVVEYMNQYTVDYPAGGINILGVNLNDGDYATQQMYELAFPYNNNLPAIYPQGAYINSWCPWIWVRAK